MNDQADRLRKLAQLAKENSESHQQSDVPGSPFEDELTAVVKNEKPSDKRAHKITQMTHVIAVTSGKGGVGKTNFVCNLGIIMGRFGKKVAIIDADLGLANIDVLLGLYPKYNLSHVMNGSMQFSDIMIKGPYDINIIPGASGLREIVDLPDEQRDELVSGMTKLDGEVDVLLVDTGAGISKNVMDFVTASDETIVVTTPEPTAIADAYALIKLLLQAKEDAVIRLVVNQAKSAAEANQVAEQMSTVSRRFLKKPIEFLGYVTYDPSVPKAVREQKPFVLAYPYSPASGCLSEIAGRICNTQNTVNQSKGLKGFLNRMLSPLSRRYEKDNETWAQG